jgi:hypothetical protein
MIIKSLRYLDVGSTDAMQLMTRESLKPDLVQEE